MIVEHVVDILADVALTLKQLSSTLVSRLISISIPNERAFQKSDIPISVDGEKGHLGMSENREQLLALKEC